MICTNYLRPHKEIIPPERLKRSIAQGQSIGDVIPIHCPSQMEYCFPFFPLPASRNQTGQGEKFERKSKRERRIAAAC
ncbi:hypothetical protein Nepgr_014613 [Nepenthes gracilis]|uniref:Uncharacterized protein n=1 Tax=Nepenthes gracilis TaxID=150966 RepID=A0AAD3SKC2_NEPGR|nr:hypothetical protein Nepgr_014613 [Nepenthes gracilis]